MNAQKEPPFVSPEQAEYIRTNWNSRWDFVLQTQGQLLNWIFTVHGGGIAGMLTYAASGNDSSAVKIALASFSIGLAFIILFGTLLLYREERLFRKFQSSANDFFDGSLSWAQFLQQVPPGNLKHKMCEVLAWTSGVCAIVGIVASAMAIL